MTTQEQHMSESKREHSQFSLPRAAGRASSRAKPAAADLLLAPVSLDLRVLESWENRQVPGGDPYNGVGARAGAGSALHK
jgi:hypothetical protein